MVDLGVIESEKDLEGLSFRGADDFRDSAAANRAVGHHLVLAQYSSGEGEPIDRMVSDYVDRRRNRVWNFPGFQKRIGKDGAVCVVVDELADRIAPAVNSGLYHDVAAEMGFDLDEAYYDFETRIVGKEVRHVANVVEDMFDVRLADLGRGGGRSVEEWVHDWIADRGRFTATSVDYDLDQLLEDLGDEFGLPYLDD